jgi:hypothetical protein
VIFIEPCRTREDRLRQEHARFQPMKQIDKVMNLEGRRLLAVRESQVPWKKCGTAREAYSDNGNAWDYFSHDQLDRL